MPQITIIIRSSSESKASVTIDSESATVNDLKQKIEQVLPDFTVSAQRLIFSGKVLKDEDLISIYKIADGNTVHVVKSVTQQQRQQQPQPSQQPSSAASNPFTAFAGLGNTESNPLPRAGDGMPGMMSSMLGMMNGQQTGAGNGTGFPDMAGMLNMMNSNPAMMEVMTQQMQQMFNNPQLLDAMSSMNPALANPEYRTMMQSMMSNPEALRAMMTLASAGNSGMQNPMAANPAMGLQQPFASMMGGANVTPAAPAMAPEDRYATQLQQLAEMGMIDGERNLRALQLSGGNVNAAIEWLFNNPQ